MNGNVNESGNDSVLVVVRPGPDYKQDCCGQASTVTPS